MNLIKSILNFRGISFPVIRKTSVVGVFDFLRFKHEYAPRVKKLRKSQKGRVTVRTGGSIKGSTLKFGDFGLRLKSEGIKMSSNHLQAADVVLRREIKPYNCKLITRFVCDIPVCVKGNHTRMGKGKGEFHHWGCRIPTGKVLFEVRGNISEKVVNEAFRKASSKLPGKFETMSKDSLIRVSPTHLIEKPEPRNFFEEMIKSPTKKWLNIKKSQEDFYQLYRNR